MITIFNRKAIYIGYSKEERNRIVKLLAENKISYDEKEWYGRGGQAQGGAGVLQARGRPTKYMSKLLITKNVSF